MTIVVAWVPRPEGDAALERGLAEAQVWGEDVLVVNASSGNSYVDPRYATTAQLSELHDRLARSGVEHEVRQELRGRQPSDEIVAAAEESDALMVVIGLRHRSSVGKFLLGSSAQEILMGVRCPVLCVPAEDSRSRWRTH